MMNANGKQVRGLFINPSEAQCSIYESGRMIFNCLKLSDRYSLDYLELDKSRRQVPTNYDFYAFNYHHVTMGWLDTRSLSLLAQPKITFVLEVMPNDPFVLCPKDAFDAYCPLDPTVICDDPRVFPFPRPLEEATGLPEFKDSGIPVIGTFGFATPGKGFDRVVEAVGKEFDRAVVKVNIPVGTYSDKAMKKLFRLDYVDQLIREIRNKAKPGIETIVTRDYLSKSDLIRWCAGNTLNCFLYHRNQPGLSATTDQAIASGRPLLVSEDYTFRHIHKYIRPYPRQSLRDAIRETPLQIAAMQKDWSPKQFAASFENVLERLHVSRNAASMAASDVELKKVRRKINPTTIRRGIGYVLAKGGIV